MVAAERISHYIETEEYNTEYCVKTKDRDDNVISMSNNTFSWNSKFNEEHNSRNPDMIRYKIIAMQADKTNKNCKY